MPSRCRSGRATAAGRLVFANKAYAGAVEARDGADAVERGIELFDRAARAGLAQAEHAAQAYRGRLPAIVSGGRRSFEVQSFPNRGGSAGIGIDVTEADRMRAELARMAEAHRRTLDQLTTGVAIFGSNQKLAFYNAAYRSLWDLDAGFLDQEPSDLAVLDRLRAARKLPEEQDFRQWKAALHDAYHATEAREHMWHLPDGRTLRVVTTPNAEGGVIYLFDDVTERLDLARRYDALIRVQGETLDNLAEAVAVFGSDGRLRLFNPVFARLWKLAPATLAERPHIETVIGWCQPLSGDSPLWRRLRAAITAIDDREQVSGRIERRDGSVIDCATVPLPDGATLVTFQDVTDTVNVERALREKNEALEEADEIKVDFVHHVSYELRSPLTNIIGFAHFLGDLATGPLNEKQREYLGYITTSTNALLAIINNILDLASIDAGAMTLDLGPVDIRRTMNDAAEGVQDRLVQSDIALAIRVAPDIGSFVADERRVRQTLFNLLANAIGFSPAGETVTLSAQRLEGRGGVLGHRPRPRHSGRREGQGVRLVRDAFARVAPSRHRARAVAGALVRGAAWRHRDDRIRRSAPAPPSPACSRSASSPSGRPHDRSGAHDGDPDRRRELLGGAAGRARHAPARGRRGERAQARRPGHAVGRSRRRQDHLRPRPDPLSGRRRDHRGAEPDLHADADLRSAALSGGACRSLPHRRARPSSPSSVSTTCPRMR